MSRSPLNGLVPGSRRSGCLPRREDDVILTTREADPLLLDPGTSPFNGLLDIYSLQRLAVTDSRNKPSGVTVHTIDPRIRGWERVEPDRT